MSKLKHIHIDNYPYFVTATTTGAKLFSDNKLADILLSCIYYARNSGWYLLLSFVIMPDHLHMIVVPRGKNISQIMKSIKGYSARIINLERRDKNVPPIQIVENVPHIQSGNFQEQGKRDPRKRNENSQQQDRRNSQGQDRRGFLTPPQSIWQEGFYDYILDTEDKLLTKIKYILNNPVKAELVLEPELYLYSSAHKQNLTDLDTYLNGDTAGQECPAYPEKLKNEQDTNR